MRIVKAALAYFALVFAAGFLLGAIRVSFLVPRLGVRTAELLEMPVMLLVILLAARFVQRRFALPLSAHARIPVGVLALMLLIAAELLLAVVFQGQSVANYIAGRDPVSGGVYLVMLVLFGAMPFILARPYFARSLAGHKRA